MSTEFPKRDSPVFIIYSPSRNVIWGSYNSKADADRELELQLSGISVTERNKVDWVVTTGAFKP